MKKTEDIDWEEITSYSTNKKIVGDVTKAKKFLSNLEKVKKQVQDKIQNAMPPELQVASYMRYNKITEEEFLAMKFSLGIDEPTFVRIANHLRDLWRNN